MPSNLDDRQQPPVRLSIPDLPPGVDTLTAALAYAEHGWYVLPVRMNTKQPGSVVGKGWPSRSSRDPKQLAAWFAGTNYGVALHAGRSGAIALDVDHPEHTPDEIALIMESEAPYQSTRPGEPGRGHYLVANTTGRRIGNSVGKLATTPAWGEIRGTNGVIIVEPSQHPSGGQYRWVRTGPLPDMPDFLAEALPTSCSAEDALSDKELNDFLDTHTSSHDPQGFTGLVRVLEAKIRDGQSLHMSTLGVLTDAMAEAGAGLYPARAALQAFLKVFKPAATGGTSTGRKLTAAEAHREFRGIAAWACAQVTQETIDAATARYRLRVPQPNVEDIIDMQEPDAKTAPPATLEEIEESFWTATPALHLIYSAAMSEMCSPWAVFAVVVARLLTLVPPHTQLPKLGGFGSLNWFAALVTKSAGGKGAAVAVAKQLVPDDDIFVRTPGSGEGMIETYNRAAEPQDQVLAVLFNVDEIDMLTSLGTRSGQTTMPVLRCGFSGETLGFAYRGRAKESVKEHSYRMTLVVSVQPARAAAILQDRDGGTPQRFMWFPATDGRITGDLNRMEKWPQRGGKDETLTDAATTARRATTGPIRIPEQAMKELRANREKEHRGEIDADKGHALFAREKLAYALAILAGRDYINDDDWKLSGIAAKVSDWTLERLKQEVDDAQRKAAVERGTLRGVERHASDASFAAEQGVAAARTLRWVIGHLKKAEGEQMRRSALRRDMTSRDRIHLSAAIATGVEHGWLSDKDGVIHLLKIKA